MLNRDNELRAMLMWKDLESGHRLFHHSDLDRKAVLDEFNEVCSPLVLLSTCPDDAIYERHCTFDSKGPYSIRMACLESIFVRMRVIQVRNRARETAHGNLWLNTLDASSGC